MFLQTLCLSVSLEIYACESDNRRKIMLMLGSDDDVDVGNGDILVVYAIAAGGDDEP